VRGDCTKTIRKKKKKKYIKKKKEKLFLGG